ncbi:MAG: fibronectin type III domain-containing protein [Planctomycetota bacterium]
MLRQLSRRFLLAAAVILALLVFSGSLLAQGRSAEAFERVRQVQERHTQRLMAMADVEGTAVGLDENDEYAVKVFTARPGVGGIPNILDGVPVRVVVAGKFYALPKPSGKPGNADKPPKAPTGLTATALTDKEIFLDWNDNREKDVIGYQVYRSTDPGLYGVATASVSYSSYTDSSELTPGTTYYYVVTAVDAGYNVSSYSNEAWATTYGGSGEPTPPAAPSDLTATAISSSQIDLLWTDNADNETGFKIERDSVQIATVGANVSSYSDEGIEPSTTYTYRVRAYNLAGDSSYSNDASAETAPPPERPPLWCERPVPIGVSTGHPDVTAGTIACRLRDIGGNVFALSNNHVYANENLGVPGIDNVLQPGTYDGGTDPDDRIGTLTAFEPIVWYPWGLNTIDAAIAVSNENLLGNATPSDGYGQPNKTTVQAQLYMNVQKYGRTTGLTKGQITGVNGAFLVQYSSHFAIFTGQILIESAGFSAGGDSGSLIVTDDNACNPVGLLFAGSSTTTIANPIDAVLDAFPGLSIDGR